MPKEILEEIIININDTTKIRSDILEKDYYVCLVLKELAKKQNDLKAYFKGGTAVYKILDEMNRFSEDIDLTVEVIKEASNTSNVNRLKKSALNYNIDGLELIKEECIDKKGSVTAFYKYDSLFSLSDLFKSGKIQVESTSFTVSMPFTTYNISPLIYKYATNEQKTILKEKYNISDFNINIISLERIFVDKLFATEFYYIREMYEDVAKHLYDITILYKQDNIKKLFKNKTEFNKLISYKREEEKNRIGGISENLEIKDFSYLKLQFNDKLIKVFEKMQNTYVLDEKYKINIEDVKNTLLTIKDELM